MGIYKLAERQVIGEFYRALEQSIGASWVPKVSNYFPSDQALEEYGWLGQVPMLREWIGGRNTKGLKEDSLTIRNKHFEATIDILVRHLRRDHSGQAMIRIRDLSRRANAHWAKLLSDLIILGPSTICYDGQYFFDTDHSEGDSGTQSNDISVDISALPVSVNGTTTFPSVEEMQLCIVKAIEAICGFKDNEGEPMNEEAEGFLVMVPVSLMTVARQAVATPVQVAASQTALEATKKDFTIDVAVNARLSSWTANFAVFRTDNEIKSFIRQDETAVDLKIKGEGSEYEFDKDAHQYGIDTWRNVGFGMWQHSCLVTMT